jgi:peptidoglycan/xylan/chitin deacetylase (PgdA/CDA1 family)
LAVSTLPGSGAYGKAEVYFFLFPKLSFRKEVGSADNASTMMKKFFIFFVALCFGMILTNWNPGLRTEPAGRVAEALSLPTLQNVETLHNSLTGRPTTTANPGPAAGEQQEYARLTGPVPNVVWSMPTSDRVVFLTVDDGWYPSEKVLTIMKEQHLPLSTFLLENAAKNHLDFWRAFVAAGGDIQNHTVSHPDLTKESAETIQHEIETAQTYLSSLAAPTLFRPPYGSYNQTVCEKASQVGLRHVVLWNATMSSDGLQTYNGKKLEPGSIILLHWVPDLPQQLEKLLDILREQDLGVASLPYALEHPDKIPVIRLKT